MSDQNSTPPNPNLQTAATTASSNDTVATTDALAADISTAKGLAASPTVALPNNAAAALAAPASSAQHNLETSSEASDQSLSLGSSDDMQHRNLETAIVLTNSNQEGRHTDATADISNGAATAAAEDAAPAAAAAAVQASVAAVRADDGAANDVAPTAIPSNIVGSAELSESVLDDDDIPVSSGSAVQILNKIIEVVEDEEAESSEDVKIVLSASEEAAAKAAEEEEKAKAKAAQEAGEEVAPKEELTITDPVPVAKPEYDAATDEDEYPELSAEDQERYNKLMLKEGDTCPACGKGTLILRQNDRVAFLGCSCFPQCKLRYYTSRSNAVVSMKTLESTCPKCGAPLEVKKGRYGLFIGCSDYPQCTYVYKDEAVHDEIECPVCKKGTLERRRARSGRIFFGCNHYPECEFIVPGIPVQSPCKECGFPIRYKKKVKAGIALVCANPECASRRRRKQEIIES